MKIDQVLAELGLQDKEADVYLALLKTPGAQPASVIATRANLNRTTVYKTLIKLVKKGLATKTQRHGIICFFAEEPDKRLEGLLQNQRKNLDMLNENLIALLPEIKNIQQQELHLPKMRYYEGEEGIKRVYEDTLAEGETIYAFEDVGEFSPKLKTWLFDYYIPRRLEKEVFAYVLTPKNPDNVSYRKNDKEALKETRFIPKTNFPIEIEINIYGQKTAFFSHKSEEIFAAILESKGIANSMKSIFNLCWKIAK